MCVQTHTIEGRAHPQFSDFKPPSKLLYHTAILQVLKP